MKNNTDKPVSVQPLVDVVKALRAPNGCPWDQKQTHESLRRYFIEETYEVVDAIDNKDMANLREELGDVLLQVVFHSQLAEEAGQFTLEDVINDVTQKMIRRHPHVFDPENNEKSYSWDELKAQEKKNIQKSVLDGVSKSLPALVAAYKLQEKAAKLGFDWDELDPVWAKVSEEMDEFKEAIAQKDRENMEKEAGDVLFSLINLLRWYKISGENALNRTNTKFKTELIASVAQKTELTKKDAEKAVKAVFDTVAEELAAGGKVQVIGFGTFEVRERAAREGRNPQNGKTITIKASKSPAFKAGKGLKEQVNAAPAKKRKK